MTSKNDLSVLIEQMGQPEFYPHPVTEPIQLIQTHAPGNNAAIGGVKVSTENGWFAARPSGTENIYKIYAESFKGDSHLEQLLTEAQALVDSVF